MITRHHHWPRVLSVNLICIVACVATLAPCQTPSQSWASGNAQPGSVICLVTALDKANHPVTDLRETDLVLSVDKKPQRITRASAATAEKLQILLLLDASGSDRETHKKLDWQGMLRFFQKTLRPGDSATIGVFSNTTRLLADWTSDVARIESAIHEAAGVQPYGPTSLYDSV